MSEGNMEIVRRVMNAWNRQNVEGILAFGGHTPIDPRAETRIGKR